MIIVKRTDASNSWAVFHRSLTGTHYLELETSGSTGPNSSIWNNTNPTSTHFTVGNSVTVNNNGGTYVAYIFAHDDASFGTDGDESIIKCGSYTGNGGSQDIDVGFEPQWFFIKRTSGTGRWMCWDEMRGSADNGLDQPSLYFHDVDAEAAWQRLYTHKSGFGINAQSGNDVNGSGETYIYTAIRRPHKPPEAATEVFAMNTHTGSIPNYISGFPVDFVIKKDGINSSGDVHVASRIQGRKFLKTNSTEAEGNAFVAAAFDHSNGFASGSGSSPDSEYLAWMFKRAPGFMDVVTYNGTGSTRTINHNLGAVPEMMVIKSRDEARSYQIYHAALGAGYYHPGFRTDPFYTSSSRWDTTPTSTVFSVKTDTDLNSSNGQGYIAYLFATLPGISKVGSYTGTGNAINVDCGFTAGARFILIKRTDTEIGGTPGTSWFLWDSVRGIVSGNDPYLLLNRDNNGVDAQVTNTDYIDPLSSGFTVTSSAPAVLNASGATYVFLAIA